MAKNRTSRESPAVERVRAARRAIAKECGYDVEKLGQVLVERQRKSKQTTALPRKKSTRV